MAGVVVRADILEDKDGKSRGIGTVTFEQSIEAVQAICILFIRIQLLVNSLALNVAYSGFGAGREESGNCVLVFPK